MPKNMFAPNCRRDLDIVRSGRCDPPLFAPRTGGRRLNGWLRQLVLCLGALALTACGAGSIPIKPTAPGTTPAGQGRIGFIGADGNLYTIQPDGQDRKAVTQDAGPVEGQDLTVSYQGPTWARGSRYLGFFRLEETSDAVRSARVQTWTPDGEVQDVYSGEDNLIYLYWGPDSETLSFLSSGRRVPELRLRLVEPGGQARVLDRGRPYYWDWAPDGSTLFAHVGGSMDANPLNARLSTLSLQDGGRRDLGVAPGVFQAPAFSPDGEQVLVVGAAGEDAEGLLLLNSSGEFVRKLADAPRATAFAWSPNGEQIAYVTQSPRDPLGFGELMLIDMNEGGEFSRRATDLATVAGFFWSPTGRELAAFVPEFAPEGEDQQVDYRRQDPRLLLHLFLVQAESGESEPLASFQPTADFLNILPFYDQYHRSATVWSPDGRQIVYTARLPSGGTSVSVVPAEPGGEAESVAEGTFAFWSFE